MISENGLRNEAALCYKPLITPVDLVSHLSSLYNSPKKKGGQYSSEGLYSPIKRHRRKRKGPLEKHEFMDHMAGMPSPLSPLSRPPRYEKSTLNYQSSDRYAQKNFATRYSQNSQDGGLAANKGILGISLAEDKLPPYAPTLQLLTLCRRKNELDGKDRKARRRSWNLVWLLLDGTVVRMYQPTSVETKKFEKEWNEKYCRKKGPAEKVAAPVGRDEDSEGDSDQEDIVSEVHSPLVGEITMDAQTITGRRRSTSVLKTPFESTSFPFASQPAPTRTRTEPLALPMTTASPSQTPISPPERAALGHTPHPNLPNILTREAYVSYPVRNITCTRATTYFKRNFVLRFVIEGGRQFLVQLNNHEETLVWQQVVKIAAPLALDIDERLMPEPTPYPRPRRRPTTAPAAIDLTAIPNVPLEYNQSPFLPATVVELGGGMRRRRSFGSV